ncbi:MAG: fimbria/pilus outer membrane usher protein [Enterobacter hormaechei]
MGDLGAFSIDVTRARALLKKQQSSTATGAYATAKISPVQAPTFLAGYRYNSKGFTLDDTIRSYAAPITGLRHSAAPVPSHHRPDATRRLGIGHAEHGEETYRPEPDMTSMSVSYNNSFTACYSLSYSMNKNTHDSDLDGNAVTNDNQFSLAFQFRWIMDA